jgi:cullin-associated NEDD8-dissociated protein 1
MQKVVNIDTTKSQDNSITSTAARTLVLSLPHPVPGISPTRQTQEAFHAINQVLIPKLIGQTSKVGTNARGFINFESPKGVSIEALDLLAEVIRCFGSLFPPTQTQLLEQILMLVLNDPKTGPIAKKRATEALASLSTQFSDDQLGAFVSRLVEDFRQSHITVQKRRVLITVVGTIAKSTSSRFAPYLQTLAPFVLSPLSQQELDDTIEAISEDDYDTATDDLKEAALLTIEDLLRCCTQDMRPFTPEVIESGLRYLAYNPTVVGGSDDEMDDETELDGLDEDEDYEQEDQFDDEDDASWKIRRSAGKMFNALISTRIDLLESGSLYDKVLPALTKVFKDREESVQLEGLRAATLIIQKTADTVPTTPMPTIKGLSKAVEAVRNPRKRRRTDSVAGVLSDEELSRGYASPAEGLPSPTSGPRTDLLVNSASVITGAINLLSQKSVSSKQASVSLLKAFVHLKHDSLAGQLDQVLKPVVEIILSSHGGTISQSISTAGAGATATAGTLRIESLQLLGVIFDTHSSKSISPFVDQVIKALASAADDRSFKIASESLDSAESVIKALTPPRAFGYENKSKEYIEEMFDIVLRKAESNDAELEVRTRAIQALGVCTARAAQAPDNLSSQRRSKALAFLHERLAGETTRVPATLAIDLILTTDQKSQLEPRWVNGVATELGNHLRKADRRVRAVGLSAIKKLTSNTSARKNLSQESLQTLTALLLQLFASEGLSHIVRITEILSDLVQISPAAAVTADFNSTICSMVVHPLGGHTLDSFLELIANVGSAGVGTPLMNDMLQKVNTQGDHQVVGTTIGTLLVSGGSTIPVQVGSFITEIHSKPDDRRVALALIVLGEVGLLMGTDSKITPDIFVESLQSRSELVQSAAASALGRAAATNTDIFLPVVFKTFQAESKNRTLGLLSVKELLQQVGKSNSSLENYSQQLWDNLFDIAAVDETRPLAAECIGRLASTDPAKYFRSLQACITIYPTYLTNIV